MGRPFGLVIGVRRLSRPGCHRVTVTLGKPRRMKDGEDWECPFRIDGLRSRRILYGYGVDAIQALTTALEGIRVTLEQNGKRLSWISGIPGDAGFERPVPRGLGLEFSRRLNRMVDREIARFVRAQERRHAKRPRNSTKG